MSEKWRRRVPRAIPGRLGIAIVLAAAMAVAAGCGDSGGGSSAADTTPASTGAPSTTSTSTGSGTSTAPATGDSSEDQVAAETRQKVSATLADLVKKSESQPSKMDFPALTSSPCRPPKKVAAGEITVGWSYPGRTNTAEVEFADSTTWYLQHHPDVKKVYVENGQENPSTQVSQIQSLVSRKVDLIIADPATTAVSVALGQACRAGVAVVVADRSVTEGTPVTATLYADEVQDGYNTGKFIVDALQGQGNVVILGGIPGNGVTEQRNSGAKMAFEEAPGIKLLATGFTSYDPAKGREIMAQYLAKYPKIDAVWSDAGPQAIGAIQALQAANRLDEVKMIAGGQFNGFLKVCAKMKLPCSGSTIAMDFGLLEAQLGIDIIEGKYLPKGNVTAPLTVIPPDQIDDYVREDLPDSYWATNLIPMSVIEQIFHE